MLYRLGLLACAATCAIALSTLPAAGSSSGSAKIHPVLEDLGQREIAAGRSPFALEGRDGRTLVRVRTRDAAELRREAPRLGAVVRAIVGPIASVEVPASALHGLASLRGVISIKPAAAYRPANDISTVEIGADAARSAYASTGRGVIVAVIDSGLDFRHGDFRNSDGSSRVLAAWDQTDAGAGGAGCGAAITLGRCWTKDDLDDDLAGVASAGLFDGYFHGTHVAGIAAGNGLATANDVPSGTYAGVAPEADLLVVKVFDSQGRWAGGDLIAAYAWIAEQAFAVDEPFVINMSLSRTVGPHDGTAADEVALDALLAPGLPGRAAAIAAGNSRDVALHAVGTAVVGVDNVHAFQIPDYTPLAGAGNDSILFDLWYAGGDDLTVSVLDASDAVLASAGRGGSTVVCTPSGRVSIDALNATDPDNLDSEVLIRISDSGSCFPTVPPPAAQTMKIQVTGVTASHGGGYQIWSDSALGAASSEVRFDLPAESGTVGEPATSLQATSAGAYWTRYCFPSGDPSGTTCVTCPPPAGGNPCPAIGELATFSAAGPTRDGRLKPELVAPGTTVSSSSADAPPQPPQGVSPDGMHRPALGTSMAAPHVTGALAVLFELNPQLDASQARQLLIDSARTDAFTGVLPNALYGNGKLAVLAGSEFLLKVVVNVVTGADDSFSWDPEPHSTTYDVYRGDLPGSLPASYGACFASGLGVPTFSDPAEPLPDAGFFYLVSGVKDGIRGSLGFDSDGRQRPNTAPCP